MRRPTKGYAAAVALGAITLLCACSTANTDPPTTTASVPSSSTATSTSSAPTPSSPPTSSSESGLAQIPEAAKINSPQGAEAFTKYFLDRANAAYNASDSALYKELISASCKTCGAMTATLDDYGAKNYRYVGDFVTPVNLTINSFTGSETSVLVSTDTQSSKVYASNGSLVEEIPAAKGKIVVQLLRENDGWRISGIKGAG